MHCDSRASEELLTTYHTTLCASSAQYSHIHSHALSNRSLIVVITTIISYLFVRRSGLEDVLHVSAHVHLSQQAIALVQHEVLHLM